jgi:nonsense-mediated mRNA decay protein 3
MGICEICRGEAVPWVTIEPRITVAFCPSCGALREKGGWVNLPVDRKEQLDRLIASAISFHPEAQGTSSSITCRDWSANRSTCMVQAKGTVGGRPVQETREVEILWKGELCTRCSRMSGGYYEGVVQVRATGRDVSDREKEIAISAAEATEEALRVGGDALSFLSRIEEVHQGIDIVVGTQTMGRMIAREILSRLGGTLSTHPKLVGEKDGIPVYRITFSVRLSRYQKGDVVEVEGRYREVRESGTKRITLYDLQSGEVRVTRPGKGWRRVGNVLEARNALVAYREKDTLGLIDPRSGVTREVPAVRWLDIAPCTAIRVVPDDERDTLIIVG